MNCSPVPSAIEGLVGVTSIEVKTAALTVSVDEPLMLLAGSMAVMVVEPTEALVARPSLPAALLTAATAVLEELQVTELVRSWVESSLKVPVAVNCSPVPRAIEGLAGVTSSEVRTAAVTVSKVEPLRLLVESSAVIVVEPTEALVARPALPAASLTAATASLDELQVTVLVSS